MFKVKNRNLFRLNRITLLYLPWLLRLLAKLRKPKKRLLIIKNDAIGDYILFRNFIEIVKNDPLYKDHQIDLLGNPVWKDVALTYDAAFINRFIFTIADDLYDAPVKTFKLGWQLFKNNYSVVLQPTYSRTLINDALAALTGSQEIIGFESTNERIFEKYKVKTDRFYKCLLLLPPQIYFEFERSKLFFERVLNRDIPLTSTHIAESPVNKSGIVIFPGAGFVKREWGKENFLALVKLIRQNTAEQIYVAGGPADVATGAWLETNLPAGSVINLTGRSTLPQLVELIASASLVIANETSAIHIAVAAKTRAVCILGGGHFERFAPYPQYFENRPLCVYQKMECYYCNWNCIFITAPTEPFPCISINTVDMVWQATQQLLPVV